MTSNVRTPPVLAAVALGAGGLLLGALLPFPALAQSNEGRPKPRSVVPLYFEELADGSFVGRGGSLSVVVTADSLSFVAAESDEEPVPQGGRREARRRRREPPKPGDPPALGPKHPRTHLVRFDLRGSAPNARVRGVGRLQGVSHHLLGEDRDQWRRRIPHYSEVVVEGVYPGVDMRVRVADGAAFEYDFELAPGVSADVIDIECQGADAMSVDSGGDLVLKTRRGAIRHRRPQSFEVEAVADIGDRRQRRGQRQVQNRYRLRGRRLGFDVQRERRDRRLVIDPVVVYESQELYGIFGIDSYTDAAGNTYVTGTGDATLLPSAGRFGNRPGWAAVVVKLDPQGEIVYTTYYGSAAPVDEYGLGVVADGLGQVHLIGHYRYDAQHQLPLLNPWFTHTPNPSAAKDAFAAGLIPDGSDIFYATYLPFEVYRFHTYEHIALEIDGLRNIYLAGYAPYPGPEGTSLYRVSPSGQVARFYIPGYGDISAIAVDSDGSLYATGNTFSPFFPVVNAFQETLAVNVPPYDWDAFVFKLDADGQLIFSTYLGGALGWEAPTGIGVDRAGNVYVTGDSSSDDFPLVNSSNPVLPGYAPFLTSFGPTGEIRYSTRLGRGNGDNQASDLAVDPRGIVYVAGEAFYGDSPPFNIDRGWLVKVDASGSIVSEDFFVDPYWQEYSYLTAVAVDEDGDVRVTQLTDSPTWYSMIQFKLAGDSFGRARVDPSCRQCPNAGEPVNIMTGNVWLQQVDLAVPGRGAAIVIARNYNSETALTQLSSPFGLGWSYPYSQSLEPKPSGLLVLHQGSGVPIHFRERDSSGRFVAVAPETEQSWITFDPFTQAFTRHFRQGGAETYDRKGNLVGLTDAVGVETILERSPSGLIVSDAGGRSVTLQFDLDGRVQTLYGPEGEHASYRYDEGGRLIGVEYVDGSGYAFGYDAAGLLLTVADRTTGQLLESHSYDSQGRGVTSAVGQGQGLVSGAQERLTFSYAPGVTTVTDQLGRSTTHEWSEIGGIKRATSRSGPCDGCGSPGSQTEAWAYFPDGRVRTHTNGAGEKTHYTYNSRGDLATETDATGRVVHYTYTYDPETGRILTQERQAPGQGTTTWTYGVSGPESIVEIISPTESRTTEFSYVGGRVETITDPRLKVTRYEYYPTGDLRSVTDPEDNKTEFGYDAMGRRTTVTDPEGHTTLTQYDRLGRVTRVTNPDLSSTEFFYDSLGRRTRVVDPLRNETHYVYDGYGRLASVLDPLTGATAYSYDAMSNLVRLTDARKQATVFEYDAFNRVVSVSYPSLPAQPGQNQESFSYDGAGRLKTKTDRNGTVTNYSYDAVGRLVSKSYSDGTPAVTFTYDLADRMETAANGSDTLSWSYDAAGQVVTETSAANGTTVGYGYDVAGNREALSLNGVAFLSYEYDDASRLRFIRRGLDAFEFGYDKASRRTSMSYPNGIVTSYGYDLNSRLLHVGAGLGATPITSFGYGYDAAGNRRSKTTLDYQDSYGYDSLYRLTQVKRTGTGANIWAYGYDAVGNRSSVQTGSELTRPTHNARNQLTSAVVGGRLVVQGTVDEAATVRVNGQPARMLEGDVFEAAVDAVPGTNAFSVEATDASANTSLDTYQTNVTGQPAAYSYDANGNLIEKVLGAETWTYEWNPENQLTRVLKDSVEIASFKYDPLGRRIEKVTSARVNAYVYDGWDALEERVTDVSGTTAMRGVYGPEVDEPLSREPVGGGGAEYFLSDGLGSVVSVVDELGAAVHSYRYDAWGNIELGQSRGGHAFTGREWDDETGLYFFRSRYYDAGMGRFLSEDPIGSGDGVNLYGYVHNNPALFRDPLGLQSEDFNQRIRQRYRDRGFTEDEIDIELALNQADAIESADMDLFFATFGGVRLGRSILGRLRSATCSAGTQQVRRKGVDALRRRITEHKQKLDDYIRNPDAFDNKGFLKNASPELRQKIIDGRVRHLQHEIDVFTRNLKKLLGE